MTRTVSARISEWGLSAEGLLTLKVFDEDPAIYASPAVGEAVSRPVDTVPLPGSTRLLLMDIPALRDQDAAAGYYAAAHGLSTDWPGAVVYRSVDGGITYSQFTSFTKQTVMGTAASVLASGPVRLWDLENTVDVSLLIGDALVSESKLNCLSGANTALLGSEIIIFQTATQLDPSTWRLSKLIRGVAGTEWAIGTHAIMERFCMMDSSANRRIVETLADLNIARKYAPVTVNTSLEDAAVQTFTDSGISLKPWSPVKVRGDGASDRVISWHRRSRLHGSNWRDFFDPPLGETPESYEIDILSDDEATVKRTLTATVEHTTYTSADQTTDFGAPKAENTIHANVYQISSEVGRGYPGHGVV